MRIAQTRLSIDTAPREIKEITAEIARWAECQHISPGLPTVYIPHALDPRERVARRPARPAGLGAGGTTTASSLGIDKSGSIWY